MNLRTEVNWEDAQKRRPPSGVPVAAAITGRYPPDRSDTSGEASDVGEEFWLVRPMYWTSEHFGEDGTRHTDCFVDSDGIVRLPYGRGGGESVTHWAELPTLPRATVRAVFGPDVRPALRAAWDTRPAD
ncbi:AQJ64_40280 family protein [Streptomyces sp. NPDC008139]|uniref:AQJ64_40280 family protein n=1 Tax=Streptomyces sp. NPDC008139 TaxID=3364814 RepID=UPI0036E698A3